jgi:(p)ppGpp synthase/HD superfamily hydrolase
MTVEVKDMKHLEKVIKSIRDVSGVIDVERVYRQAGS